MAHDLRRTGDRGSFSSIQKRRRVHPEAPQPGEEVLYVDFSRERLEALYQQAP
jgi:hypothetical protein